MDKKKYIFYATTSKGFCLKVAFEAIASVIKSTNIVFDETGIFHRKTDENKTILFDAQFLREDFENFYCKRPLEFCVNMRLLCHAIKNVKRKNPIVLYIKRKNPNELGITILPPETSSNNKNFESENTKVVITVLNNFEDMKSAEVETDQDYGDTSLPEIYLDEDENEQPVFGFPKVILSTNFQRIKNAWSSSKSVVTRSIQVEIQGSSYISFKSDSSLLNSKVKFGRLEEETEDNKIYKGEFSKDLFAPLTKLQSMGKQIQFYAPLCEGFPLKIATRGDIMGTITVYIKDNNQIELEKAKNIEIRSQAPAITIKKSTRRKRKK